MSDQKERYLNSKVFCMLPWVHMHLWPNGDTYPCCLAESRMPVGNSHKNSLQELWNNKNMKNLRNNMLQGRESLECRRCYEQEDSGLETLRTSSNKEFAHHWWKVEETEEEPKAKRGRKTISGISDVFGKLIKDDKIVPFDDDKPLEEYSAKDWEELIEANLEEKANQVRQELLDVLK